MKLPNALSLSKEFRIPGRVGFDSGQGNLAYAKLQHPQGDATVYMHGAHVTSFQPHGQPDLLWVSDKSEFLLERPIRGGIPLCFPWFGPKRDDLPDLLDRVDRRAEPEFFRIDEPPAHGLARIMEWDALETHADDDATTLVLGRAIAWFDCRYTIRVNDSLSTQLSFTYRPDLAMPSDRDGAGPPPDFVHAEAALHTYLNVLDVRKVHVAGLESASFVDKMQDGRQIDAAGEPIRFSGETDRVYLDSPGDITVHDPGLSRTITVSKTGSTNTVVWNPWVDKAKRMPDFGDKEWPHMMCVETAAVGPGQITLSAGESHTIGSVLSGKADR